MTKTRFIELAVAVLILTGHQVAIATSSLTDVPAADQTTAEESISATFYADSSCLLRINERNDTGRTVIDAKVDAQGSRMMIHCDTTDGQRLTLLANGNSLGSRERVALLTAAEMDSGEDGMVAWLTLSDAEATDLDVPQRFLSGGQVMIRETPVATVAGSALQSGQQYFASVKGILEPVLSQPSDDVDGEGSIQPPELLQPTASESTSR